VKITGNNLSVWKFELNLIKNINIMTQIILDIENDNDTKLFLELAKKLNVKYKTSFINQVEVASYDWNKLIENGKSFDFLNDEAEDIYSDKNLKVKF
jgi:hypothetical protein